LVVRVSVTPGVSVLLTDLKRMLHDTAALHPSVNKCLRGAPLVRP
jgi:hypothetical protein